MIIRSQAERYPDGHRGGTRQPERPENQDFSAFLDAKRSRNGEGHKTYQHREGFDAECGYRVETQPKPFDHQQYL